MMLVENNNTNGWFVDLPLAKGRKKCKCKIRHLQKNRGASTFSSELEESLGALSHAITDGTQTAKLKNALNRVGAALLNFIRPLSITMTIDAAADCCGITSVLAVAYPDSFPDLPTARSMLRGAGIDASVAALRDYARFMAAVGERLGNLADDRKDG